MSHSSVNHNKKYPVYENACRIRELRNLSDDSEHLSSISVISAQILYTEADIIYTFIYVRAVSKIGLLHAMGFALFTTTEFFDQGQCQLMILESNNDG